MQDKSEGTLSRWRQRARKLGPRGGMALADQAAVGAAGFLTSIIVGRVCGPAEFGLFALGITLVILLVGVLESLITTPYVVFVSRLTPQERTAYAGSALVQYGLLLTAVSLVLAVAAIACASLNAGPAGLPAVLATLAALAPLRLLRELSRRLAYAELNIRSALGVGVSVLVLQLSAVGLLAWSGRLTAVTALAGISLTSGLAGGGWLLVHRRDFSHCRGRFRWAMARSYELGRWFFASQTLSITASHTIPWLVVMVLDKERAGIYAACAAIVALANPLVTTAGNVLTPVASRTYAERGVAGVRQLVRRATWLLGGMAVCFALFLFVAGNRVLGLLFGEQYAGYGAALAVLALAEVVAVCSIPVVRANMVFERPAYAFFASLSGIAAMLTTSLVAMPHWGVAGAAAGRLAGATTGTSILVASYFFLCRVLRDGKPGLPDGAEPSEAADDTPAEPASAAPSESTSESISATPEFAPGVLIENVQ